MVMVMVRVRVRVGERVYLILIIRVSARVHGTTGYGWEGRVETARQGR